MRMWLTASASAGVSRNVGIKIFEKRMVTSLFKSMDTTDNRKHYSIISMVLIKAASAADATDDAGIIFRKDRRTKRSCRLKFQPVFS